MWGYFMGEYTLKNKVVLVYFCIIQMKQTTH